MAKQTPPEDKFVNRINLDTFQVSDAYMLVKTAFQRKKHIHLNEDVTEVGDFPHLIVQVGPDIADLKVGMEIYVIPGSEGVVVYREDVEGDVPKLGYENALLKSEGKPLLTERGIIGFHNYMILDRGLVFGYRDLREVKPELTEEVKPELEETVG